jgi:hypothetical protein
MSSRILLCSSGLALGLRPLLSSPARAILTGIQNFSAVLPFVLVFGSLVSLLEFSGLRRRLAGWFWDPVILFTQRTNQVYEGKVVKVDNRLRARRTL